MDLDVPAPVDAFECRNSGLGKVQMLGKRVREALCRRLVANQAGNRGISGAIHNPSNFSNAM
jgi:hypothetical protein